MKPYGREEKLQGRGKSKIDHHPKRGYMNWWEDIKDCLCRSRMKQNVEKEIKKDLFEYNYCNIQAGFIVKAHGQEAVVTEVVFQNENIKFYLDRSIVVPSGEYTRDWVYIYEVSDYLN